MLLDEIYRTRQVFDREGKAFCPFPAGVPRESLDQLTALIAAQCLYDTLEVGMAYGLSTLGFCQVHEQRGQGCHLAIDPYQESAFHSIGVLNLERAGLNHRLDFRQADSHQMLPQLVREDRQFDFALVDGSHFYDHILVDFCYVNRLLKVGGYVAFDDIWDLGVRKAVNYVRLNYDYEMVPLPASPFALFRGIWRCALRCRQNPLDWTDWPLKRSPHLICVLRKRGEDRRKQYYYRPS